MAELQREFKPFYPDVLGAVTGGKRITLEKLQFALGVFPRQVFVNQPFEALIVLQSMVNTEMQVKVAVRLPDSDKRGNPAVIDTPNAQISIKLSPGEVGILRVPIIARPPTNPGKDFPLRLAVRYRTEETSSFVRPPGGGAPPSVLSISPFKLQVLRDIEFSGHTWNESAEIVTAYFDIAPKRISGLPQMPRTRYEELWSHEQMSKEIVLAKARLEDARLLAQSSRYSGSYPALLDAVEERFAERGMPLHPGEIMAVAKMMAYTLDEAPSLEQIDVEQTRWFLALCQVLAHNPELIDTQDRNELIAHYVFNELLYEAILMGFRVIEHKISENLGSQQERIAYANRILNWWAGRGDADLSYIYLPLVLGGLTINRLVRHMSGENPWEIVDNLREAMAGRVRLADGDNIIIFDMLEEQLDEHARHLRAQRIERH